MTGLRLVAGALALGLVGAGAQVEASTLNLAGAPGARQSELLLRVAVQPYSLSYSVRNIQILLNELGYNAGTPDGSAGNKTKQAISAFQGDMGFPVNGTPSKVVFIQLQKAVAAMQGGGGMPQSSGTQMSSSGSSGGQSGGASSSEMILETQAALRQLGYTVSITGQMDAATTAAIRDYQVDNGLPMTGQVDQTLLASLGGGGQQDMGQDMGGQDMGDMGDQDMGGQDMGGQDMGGGATPDEAYEIEQYLEALGYDTGTADGTVDGKTQQAIMAFQNDMDLPVDGQASAELLVELQTAYSEALAEAEGGGMDQGGMDQGGMDQGGMDQGGMGMGADPATVQAIEQALKQKGYAVGTVDGTIDMQSQKAIDDFIRHAQLAIPNQPSAQLLAAIQSSNMTAKKGMQNDLIKSGVDALTNILSQ